MGKQMKLRPYQVEVLNKCLAVFQTSNVCYLAGDVRTGKTLVALHLAWKVAQKVLFVTKKLAIGGIEKQWRDSGLDFVVFRVTNYERLHYEEGVYDLIIVDEAHTLGAFPKPAKRAKVLRYLTGEQPVRCLLLSGTPSPESYSQLFHQLWATRFQGWGHYTNFYKWAKDYVDIRKMYYTGLPVNDYTRADWNKIAPVIDGIRVTMTQEDAGFKGTVRDVTHTIPLSPETTTAIRAIVKEGLYEPLKLAAMSAAQRMSYVHQLCSGTVINVEAQPKTVDMAKVAYIVNTWGHKKRLAIFYCYVQEGVLLRQMFPGSTNDPEEFAKGKRHFITQIRSGQEGVDLRGADVLIFYNIAYSASSYFQARARQQHRDARDLEVHWLFSDYGLEQKIFNLIQHGKAKFTVSHFRKNYPEKGSQNPSGRRLVCG